MKKYIVLIFCVLLFSTFLIAQNRLPEVFVDNLGLDSNTISSTNTNGDINLQPNGTGSVVVSSDLDVGNINLDLNTILTTNTNGNLLLEGNGTGYVRVDDTLNVTGNVFIGGAGPGVASAVLQANSTTQGFLPPRMTAAQRDAINSPAEGLLVYANDTNKLSVYTGTTWTDVGSGGAGTLDTVFTEDHEDTFSMTTQNNATFMGSGSFVGTAAANTSTQINGDRDFLYTMATGCANDYAASQEITVTEKADDNWVGISLYYKMSAADDSVKFVLYDETNDEVLTPDNAYFKQTTNATRFETAVYIPDGVTSIRYGFQVETCTNTETFQWDDIEISTNPFVYKDIVKKNSLELQGNDARAITANTESIPFDGSGTGWTSGANGSTPTNGNYYTVQNDNSVIQISGNVDWNGSLSTSIVLALNGTQYKRIGGATSEGQHSFQYTSSEGEFSAGDQIAFISNVSGTLASSTQQHHLTIVEQWQAEHVVTAAQSSETETNILSADVTTTTNPVGDLTFSNLVIGQKYFLNAQFEFSVGGNENTTVVALHDGSTIATAKFDPTAGSAGQIVSVPMSVFFTATATTLTFSYTDGGATSALLGNNTQAETFAQLTNVTAQFLAAIPVQQTAYIKDVKSSGTTGGTFNSGAWQTRDLNTLEGDTSWISLSSNQFTLAPGKYEITAVVPAFRVDRHKAKLRNITDSTDVILGSSEHSERSIADGTSSSLIQGTIEITSSKTYEIQHRSQQTDTNGFGLSTSFGVDEVYTTVKITKID